MTLRYSYTRLSNLRPPFSEGFDITTLGFSREFASAVEPRAFPNIGINSYFMLLSTMPDELREQLGYYGVGGCGANIAWHTEEDLLDIADRDILLKDMRIYAAATLAAANATVAPFDFARTVAGFSETLGRYDAGACGRFDFSASRQALSELRVALEKFAKHTATLARRDRRDRVPPGRRHHRR